MDMLRFEFKQEFKVEPYLGHGLQCQTEFEIVLDLESESNSGLRHDI